MRLDPAKAAVLAAQAAKGSQFDQLSALRERCTAGPRVRTEAIVIDLRTRETVIDLGPEG